VSLISRLLKANPSAQVSDMLTGYFVIPSAKGAFVPQNTRAVFSGGYISDRVNTMDYIDIATTGNATSFGTLSTARDTASGVSSETRGVICGGANSSGPLSSMEYITLNTTGNATSFGNLTTGAQVGCGFGDKTRGIVANSQNSSGGTNNIDYFTIATTGNATSFGTTTVTRVQTAGCSSPTRGCIAGGYQGSPEQDLNVIDYVTIQTTGNATDFGDLTVARRGMGGSGSNTRGIFHSGAALLDGSGISSTIDYITIATTGNATNFGTALEKGYYLNGTSDNIRAVFGGRPSGISGVSTDTIEYVTIATTGNGVDFGNLTSGRQGPSANSGAHGGLQ